MRTFLIILLILSGKNLAKAQTLDKFSIDNGGASISSGGIELIYNLGEVNIAERLSPAAELSEGFVRSDDRILISARVFLQGPLLSPITPGLMNDDLRILGYLPTNSPFPGGSDIEPGVLNVSGNDAIVDWVYISIRDSNNLSLDIAGTPALLQRDGDVVATDGISAVVLTRPHKDYLVVIFHRNHLGVMSDSSINLSEVPAQIDFTSNSFPTYGSNAQVQMPSGDMALWAGDTNFSRSIRFSGANNDTNVIKDFILADPANGFNSVTFSSMGYLNTDLNLDGIARFSGAGNDSNLIKDNVLTHPGNGFNNVTYIINSTVPSNNN